MVLTRGQHLHFSFHFPPYCCCTIVSERCGARAAFTFFLLLPLQTVTIYNEGPKNSKGTLLRHNCVGTVLTRGQHSHFLFRCPCRPSQYTMKSHKIRKALCCSRTVSERFRQADSTSILLFAGVKKLKGHSAAAPVWFIVIFL
jgi:hypothetical protein